MKAIIFIDNKEVFQSNRISGVGLDRYKARYRSAKTSATRTRVYNEAILNLSGEQKEVFAKWQAKRMQNA